MNPQTAAKTAAKGTEYIPALSLTYRHQHRIIRIEGDKGIYQLERIEPKASFIELTVTKSGRRTTLALSPRTIVEVQP